MPKELFFKLDEEKRDRVINAAVDEFYEYGYHKASISRIVKRASIAKGSFYHYFEEKDDLYKYLFELGGERKIKYIGPVLMNIGAVDFFTLLRDTYLAGIRFSISEPKFSAIGQELVTMTNVKIKDEIMAENDQKGIDFFMNLLKMAQVNGELRLDLDLEFVAKMIIAFNMNIVDLYLKECGEGPIDEEESMMKFVDKMIDMLSLGIKKQNNE